MSSIKCPNCGESYYKEEYSVTTCLGWTPIYKDGVLINEDPNTITTYCHCCNCGEHFAYNNKEKNAVQASLDYIISRPHADVM